MGRTGLRAVLRWCLCFCAALATASIPVAVAQNHAPKIAPPVQNSALNSAKETPAPTVSLPEEASSPATDPGAAFTPADGLPLAGERGITHPVCLQCPPALYSYPALMRRIQGNVTMDAIVSKDGWASDVKILGAVGSGLDEQAVKAVRTWQWKPAQDAKGNPVVAHQTVIITFRLLKQSSRREVISNH